MAGGVARREGVVYGYDRPNSRVIALGKVRRRLQRPVPARRRRHGWDDLRGFYVVPGVDPEGPRRIVWLSRRRRPPGRPRGRCPTPAGGASPSPQREPEHRARARQRADAHQEALTGDARDPAARRQPDAADAGRHARAHRRLLRRVRLGARAAWRAAARPRSTRSSPTWGVVPADLVAAWGPGDFLSRETATLVTSQFLHGGWLHLLGNLLYLWIFGNNVEDRFGRAGFLAVLPSAAASGRAGPGRHRPDSTIPTIGASGAIAATLGAYFVLFPRARITSLVFLGFFYQLIEVPAIIVLGFWFVLQLLDGLASLGAIEAGGGVAFFAHIGGFVAGAVLARAADQHRRARRRRPASPRLG